MPDLSPAARLSIDLINQQLELVRVAEGDVRDLLSVLDQADQELLSRIAGLVERGRSPERIAFYEGVRREIRTAYAAAYQRLGGLLDERMAAEVERSGAAIAGSLRDAFPSLAVQRPDWGAVASIASQKPFQGALLKEHMAKLEAGHRQRVAGAIAAGVASGEGVDEIVRRVRGTQRNGFRDGVLSVPRHRAEALVRTTIITAASEARHALYAANDDLIKGIRAFVTLDDATCLRAGTKVVTDRGWRAIEAVSPGDLVLTGKGRYQAVTATRAKLYQGEMVSVQAKKGAAVTATSDHLFETPGGWWKRAGELRLGGQVVLLVGSLGGEDAQFLGAGVSAVEVRKRESVVVYDLQVDGDQSFVAEGFVVHNCKICAPRDGKIWVYEGVLEEVQEGPPTPPSLSDQEVERVPPPPPASQVARERVWAGTPAWLRDTYAEGAGEANARLVASTFGVEPAEAMRALQGHVEAAVGRSRAFSVVTPDVLRKIIEDGRFKSQHESGSSRGFLSPDYRREFEEGYFGPWPDAAKSPVYGFLSDDRAGAVLGRFQRAGDGLTVTVEQYGSIAVRLREDVHGRTTWTAGDSLNLGGLKEARRLSQLTDDEWAKLYKQQRTRVPFEAWRREYLKDGTPSQIPSSVATPSAYSLGDPLFPMTPLGGGQDALTAYLLRGDQGSSGARNYWEVQVHGGVRLSDIDEVVFWDRWEYTQAKPLLDSAGIRSRFDPWQESVEELLKASRREGATAERGVATWEEMVTAIRRDREVFEAELARLPAGALPGRIVDGALENPLATQAAAAKAAFESAAVRSRELFASWESLDAKAAREGLDELVAIEVARDFGAYRADILARRPTKRWSAERLWKDALDVKDIVRKEALREVSDRLEVAAGEAWTKLRGGSATESDLAFVSSLSEKIGKRLRDDLDDLVRLDRGTVRSPSLGPAAIREHLDSGYFGLEGSIRREAAEAEFKRMLEERAEERLRVEALDELDPLLLDHLDRHGGGLVYEDLSRELAGAPIYGGDRVAPPLAAWLHRRLGYDALPEAVESLADFDGPRLWRGVQGWSYPDFKIEQMVKVETSQLVDDFYSGRHFVGRGISGSGSYFTTARAEALSYAGSSEAGLIHAKLRPGSRVIDYDQVKRLQREVIAHYEAKVEEWRRRSGDLRRAGDAAGADEAMRRARGYGHIASLWGDEGAVAAAFGYDAIRIPEGARGFYFVVLNRGALLYRADRSTI